LSQIISSDFKKFVTKKSGGIKGANLTTRVIATYYVEGRNTIKKTSSAPRYPPQLTSQP
jgi:hypothetical protein